MTTKSLSLMLLAFILLIPGISYSQEISLYDNTGAAVAYIDTSNDLTIYLWGGRPAAFLDGHSIYGFNGQHLGWLEHGIIWNHAGNAVGFIQGATNMTTQIPPIKGIQEIVPIRAIEELAPLEPLHTDNWSSVPLALFLAQGS